MTTDSNPHPSPTVEISVSEVLGQQPPSLGLAPTLARAVTAPLASGTDVVLSFAGVRGVASSFCNSLFRSVSQQAGSAALDRLRFKYDSATQELVVSRSFAAIRAE